MPKTTQATTGFRGWLATAALLIFAGIAVPYGVLTGVWSVPIFWLAFGFAVIALILGGTRGWRDAA